MIDSEPRYAVYFVPAADSELYRFGSTVLQYDCYTGTAIFPPAEFRDQPDEWRKATEEPRRFAVDVVARVLRGLLNKAAAPALA